MRSLEDLSAQVAHEIRNPISAAKSLVQQMGEDPTSSDNIEFADVALSELDRVERSISHLLRYAREEELRLRYKLPLYNSPYKLGWQLRQKIENTEKEGFENEEISDRISMRVSRDLSLSGQSTDLAISTIGQDQQSSEGSGRYC